MSAFYLSTYLILWVLVLTQLLALAALYHHFGAIALSSRRSRESQGPELDSRLEIQPQAITTLDGRTLRINELNRSHLLVFVSTACQPCAALKDELREFVKRSDVVPVVICTGPQEKATRDWSASLIEDDIIVVHDDRQRISARVGVAVTPFLVGRDSAAVVRVKGLVNDLATLMRSARIVEEASSPSADSGAHEFVANKRPEVSHV